MPIQEQTLIEAILQGRNQLDFVWQFFVTVQLAMFALLLIYDEAVDNMTLVARSLAIGAIGLFDWINGTALAGVYNLLDALHQQYRHDYGQPKRFVGALYESFVAADYSGRETLLMVTHGVSFTFVVLALIWPHFIQHSAKKASARSNL